MHCEVGTDVTRAARLLATGRLVAFPTETVYGLGGNALDPHAVAAIFDAKGRPRFDPLIVHVAGVAAARELTLAFPPLAQRLAERFWPGPLTLVLPRSDRVPDLVTAGLATVAVRVPRHPLALELLSKADVPVAAPSANPFGCISPTTAEHVVDRLGDRIDYVLDGGPCPVGVESTVLYLAGDRPTMLRPGGVSLEDLEEVVCPIDVFIGHRESEECPQRSPGMLGRHYAPQTPLMIVETLPDRDVRSQCGLLTLTPVDDAEDFAAVEVLTTSGDLTEAAASFYAALRRLDAAGVSRIVSLRFPHDGLGRALNDRLRRAATAE